MKLIRARDYGEMSRRAANLIFAQVTLKPDSVLGLATGSTPIGIYDCLADWFAGGDLDFGEVTTINLDEYCGLAPTHPQSYRYFMQTHLFGRVNINPARTNVPLGMAEPEAESTRYDALIAGCGGIDMQLLGIGHNGHIGFNEPGSSFERGTHCVELSQSTLEANARFFKEGEEMPRAAITMGMGAIMQAGKILLVASGKEKAGILDKALNGPVTPEIPASLLQLHPNLIIVTGDM